MFFRSALGIIGVLSLFVFFGAREANAASFSLQPSAGTFTVGSVVDISLYLDTQKDSINAVEAFLSFPPDKFQLISPTTGVSIIDIWTSQPRFNNQTGTIELRGGIPRGIVVSEGLITTMKFRVKSTGTAAVKLLDESRAFLNDGKGTDALYQTQNGVYKLVLPPPAGPIVASETHPDQSRWYPNATAVLNWTHESNVDGYSYILNSNPVDNSDDTSEDTQDSVAYRNLGDGPHFFHIKALRNGSWGGTTHFAVQVDTTPPAEYSVEVIPSPKTTERQPTVKFLTTDKFSGVDHYEFKLISLSGQADPEIFGSQPLFIEAESPYNVPELELGTYDVIVRAYDGAGNFREVTERLRIVIPLFEFVQGQGLVIKDVLVIPWFVVWLVLLLLIAILAFIAWSLRRWHRDVGERKDRKELPQHVEEKLKELKKYRQRYGTMAILLLVALQFFSAPPAIAEEVAVGPPFVTSISEDISNEEIFYIGGKTEASNTEVTIYLQNLRTGETLSESTISEKGGDWFYRHDSFLSPGEYLLWTQSRIGEQQSPPSPQIRLQVQATAVQFGASRVSFEMLYLLISIVLFVVLVAVGLYAFSQGRHAKRKHREFMEEIREAEESVRRGFAVLRRDIQAELAIVDQTKMSKELSEKEKEQEVRLLRDLEWAEQNIGKEIWDIREVEEKEE